jgi:hypothetical protein
MKTKLDHPEACMAPAELRAARHRPAPAPLVSRHGIQAERLEAAGKKEMKGGKR